MVGLALGVSAVAKAETVSVFHEVIGDSDPFEIVHADFKVNEERPELSRAWVEVVRRKKFSSGEDRVEESTASRNVAGLSYDSSSREIRYRTAGGSTIVCGRLEVKRFLFIHWEKITATGACILSGRVLDGQVDDGFRTRPRSFADVVMEISTSGKIAETSEAERFPASFASHRVTRDPR